VDSQAVAVAAKQLPYWDFILIGPQFGGREIFGRNIYHLGMRAYERLPAYLHEMDVTLIPFVDNHVTRAANPVKLWEYLATGKPVVSTPIPEVLPLRGLVRIAESANLAREIASAMNDHYLQAERVALARANSWEARYEAIAKFLPELSQT
jgi:glycosyltransferase involved in cell wall biosynthesis